MVLRSFPSAQALDEQPLGEAELAPQPDAIGSLVGLDQGLFASFPGLPVHAGGKLGGFYEMSAKRPQGAPVAGFVLVKLRPARAGSARPAMWFWNCGVSVCMKLLSA